MYRVNRFFEVLFKNIKNLIRNIFYFILIGAGLVALVVVSIMLFNDLHGNEAKKYLVEKYGFSEKELFVEKFTEYEDEDVANCDSLWFKKCTSDKNLAAKYYFKVKKTDKKIVVTEDSNAKFTDDYDAETTKEWKEKEAKEKEAERLREEQLKKDREALQNK